MVIVGHQMELVQEVPLKEYAKLFTDAAPVHALGKTAPKTLQRQLYQVEQKSLAIIRALPPADLDSGLVPTPVPHPIAKTKFEALDWNVKHTMWHCGQLGILKRIVHERYDFGLRKPT